MSLPDTVTQLEGEIADLQTNLAKYKRAQMSFPTISALLADTTATDSLADGIMIRILDLDGFDLVVVSAGTVHYTAASGTEFRLRMDRATPLMLGAAGDGTTDDKTAIDALEASDCIEIDLAGRDYRYIGAFSTAKPLFGGRIIDNSTTADFQSVTRDGPIQAVPAGIVSDFAGLAAPTGYLLCNGQAYARSDYVRLFEAITLADTVGATSGSAVLTGLADTSMLGVGMLVEGTGIPSDTTIASVDGASQITLSASATASNAALDVRILPWGAGDGSTTFNVPELRAEFRSGWDGGRGVDAGRVVGSAQPSQIKEHSHPLTYDLGSTEPGQTTRVASVGLGTVAEDQDGDTGNAGGSDTYPRNVSNVVIIKT